LPIPSIADLALRAPRVAPPAALARLCSTDDEDRAAHTFGKAYRDVIRALRWQLEHPPHAVSRPARAQDAVDLLTGAAAAGAVTPSGVMASWRLPASGAGPSPDRLLLGSEGTLGVITEAWMRVRPRPTERASASVRFTHMQDGLSAVRTIAQSGLRPSNCRLL